MKLLAGEMDLYAELTTEAIYSPDLVTAEGILPDFEYILQQYKKNGEENPPLPDPWAVFGGVPAVIDRLGTLPVGFRSGLMQEGSEEWSLGQTVGLSQCNSTYWDTDSSNSCSRHTHCCRRI